MDGVVNKHNVQFWATEHPHQFHERERIMVRKLLVGCQIKPWNNQAIFFYYMVKSDHYLAVLHNNFMLQLTATGLPTNTQWFMQDGARPHTANVVLDFLYVTFGPRVISHRFPGCHDCGQVWPLHSLDINPCDFFL
jgi:hypothetical protein